MCRHSLHHKEVKMETTREDEDQSNGEQQENDDEQFMNEVTSLMNSRINLYNSLSRISSHPFGPRFDRSYQDINDLNRAILASLE